MASMLRNSNTSSASKLILAVIIFILLLLILRTPTTQFKEYLPAKAEQGHQDTAINEQLAEVLPETHNEEESSEIHEEEPPVHEPQNEPLSEEKITPRSRVSLEMQEYLSWDPPVEENHYPPYSHYRNRDYDPNRWEGFEQNNMFYTNSSIRQLAGNFLSATPYLPYPKYNSDAWLDEWIGEYVYCVGPRGVPFNVTYDDMVMAYNGVPEGFPTPSVGSYSAVGLDAGACFDRYSRLGAYGTNPPAHESTTLRVNTQFDKVNWGDLQNECLARNQARYNDSRTPDMRPGISRPESVPADNIQDLHTRAEPLQSTSPSQKYKTRSAVLIRTWDTYDYQENDLQAIRSLVSELSLLSGGEYHVFLFVHVKDLSIPIFDDPETYNEVLKEYVPAELRDMAILWTEEICQKWYPEVGEWSVYWQQFMPLQWFSETHAEYDHVWNWEMDARYIGQHYHFVEQVSDFARNQPRKYLWERNSRYYIPSLHGSYAEFTESTNDIIATSSHIQSIWGPETYSPDQVPLGPTPPKAEADDNFQWGVGEEADLITLLPMWDPRDTWWSYRDKLFNYPAAPDSPDDRLFPHVPRRTFINTLARFSKKLLNAMHIENQAGLAMASEMWPSSIALQHGLKAVYAPHPIWFSHNWPPQYMDFVFNADGWGAGSLPGGNIDEGRGVAYNATADDLRQPQTGTGPNGEGMLGRWSQERDSPYSPDREHNFGGWSWYFWSDFPRVLYSRWMGWQAGFNIVTIEGKQVSDDLGKAGGHEWEEKHGRMCLPGMLLHPVKNVRPPDTGGSEH